MVFSQRNLTRSYAGNYTCTARNGVGLPVSRSIQLHVLCELNQHILIVLHASLINQILPLLSHLFHYNIHVPSLSHTAAWVQKRIVQQYVCKLFGSTVNILFFYP